MKIYQIFTAFPYFFIINSCLGVSHCNKAAMGKQEYGVVYKLGLQINIGLRCCGML